MWSYNLVLLCLGVIYVEAYSYNRRAAAIQPALDNVVQPSDQLPLNLQQGDQLPQNPRSSIQLRQALTPNYELVSNLKQGDEKIHTLQPSDQMRVQSEPRYQILSGLSASEQLLNHQLNEELRVNLDPTYHILSKPQQTEQISIRMEPSYVLTSEQQPSVQLVHSVPQSEQLRLSVKPTEQLRLNLEPSYLLSPQTVPNNEVLQSQQRSDDQVLNLNNNDRLKINLIRSERIQQNIQPNAPLAVHLKSGDQILKDHQPNYILKSSVQQNSQQPIEQLRSVMKPNTHFTSHPQSSDQAILTSQQGNERTIPDENGPTPNQDEQRRSLVPMSASNMQQNTQLPYASSDFRTQYPVTSGSKAPVPNNFIALIEEVNDDNDVNNLNTRIHTKPHNANEYMDTSCNRPLRSETQMIYRQAPPYFTGFSKLHNLHHDTTRRFIGNPPMYRTNPSVGASFYSPTQPQLY